MSWMAILKFTQLPKTPEQFVDIVADDVKWGSFKATMAAIEGKTAGKERDTRQTLRAFSDKSYNMKGFFMDAVQKRAKTEVSEARAKNEEVSFRDVKNKYVDLFNDRLMEIKQTLLPKLEGTISQTRSDVAGEPRIDTSQAGSLKADIDHINNSYMPFLLEKLEAGNNTELNDFANWLEGRPKFIKKGGKLLMSHVAKLYPYLEKHPKFTNSKFKMVFPIPAFMKASELKESVSKNPHSKIKVEFSDSDFTLIYPLKTEEMRKTEVDKIGAKSVSEIETEGRKTVAILDEKGKKTGKEKTLESEIRPTKARQTTSRLMSYREELDTYGKKLLGHDELPASYSAKIEVIEDYPVLAEFFGIYDMATQIKWKMTSSFKVKESFGIEDVRDYYFKLLLQQFPNKNELLPDTDTTSKMESIFARTSGKSISLQKYFAAIFNLKQDDISSDEIFEGLFREMQSNIYLDYKEIATEFVRRVVDNYKKGTNPEEIVDKRKTVQTSDEIKEQARNSDLWIDLGSFNEDTKSFRGDESKRVWEAINENRSNLSDKLETYREKAKTDIDKKIKGFGEAEKQYFDKLVDETPQDFDEDEGLWQLVNYSARGEELKSDIRVYLADKIEFSEDRLADGETIYSAPKGSALQYLMDEFNTFIMSFRPSREFNSWRKNNGFEEGRVKDNQMRLLVTSNVALPKVSQGIERKINSFPALKKGLLTMAYHLALDKDKSLYSIMQSKVKKTVRGNLDFFELLKVIQNADLHIGSKTNNIEQEIKKLSNLIKESNIDAESNDLLFEKEVDNLVTSYNKAIKDLRKGMIKITEAKLKDIAKEQEYYLTKVGRPLYRRLQELKLLEVDNK
jgi:hypothetical protein